jgi:hypothetical protein
MWMEFIEARNVVVFPVFLMGGDFLPRLNGLVLRFFWIGKRWDGVFLGKYEVFIGEYLLGGSRDWGFGIGSLLVNGYVNRAIRDGRDSH